MFKVLFPGKKFPGVYPSFLRFYKKSIKKYKIGVKFRYNSGLGDKYRKKI